MGTAIALYILLLIVFLIISGLILRHTIKFNYLSPRFKYIVGVFGIIAVTVIIFSVYLLFKMESGSTTHYYETVPSSSTPSSGSGNLNF